MARFHSGSFWDICPHFSYSSADQIMPFDVGFSLFEVIERSSARAETIALELLAGESAEINYIIALERFSKDK
jgi:hypothetical protein